MPKRLRQTFDGARWLIANEWVILLVLAVLFAGLWAFFEVTDEVLEGESKALDETVLLFFRNPDDLSDPIGPPWVEEAARDITAMGSMSVQVIVVTIALGALLITRKPRAAALVLFAVLAGIGISTALKQGFQRPRPDIVPHVAEVMTPSFPSGHSLTSAVTFLVVGVLMGWAQRGRLIKLYYAAAALVIVVLIGISRVYLGVHYPTDVVAGWAVGVSWALLCWLMAEGLRRRGHLLPAPTLDAEEGGTAPDPPE